MELLICLWIAAMLTGVRPVTDAIQAMKGVEPPHLAKARLKAERDKQKLAADRARRDSRGVRPGEDKPTIADVARVYWGDAMADAIDLHNRRREQKKNPTPQAAGQPAAERLSLLRQLKHLMLHPVGDPKPGPVPAEVTEPTPAPTPPTGEPTWMCLGCELLFTGPTPAPQRCIPCAKKLPRAAPDDQAPTGTAHQGDDMTQVTQPVSTPAGTGEAVNYETAMAELEALEAPQQAHLEQAQAALQHLREAKAAISNTQATYRPAANAAQSIHEQLEAKNLNSETLAQTGTVADAMPPNRVDEMFTQLEVMEADALQQVANAEAALAATVQARQIIIGDLGDANTTVQEKLGGDSSFLAGTGAHAA